MKKDFTIGILIVFVAVCLSLPVSSWAGEYNVIDRDSKTVGDDQIPYTIEHIRGHNGLTAWIENNYTADSAAPVHLIPESVSELTVEGKKAIAFRTREYNGSVQNLIIEEDKENLTHYRVPDGEIRDGGSVLAEILGIELPESSPAGLEEPAFKGLESTLGEALSGNTAGICSLPASCDNGSYPFGKQVGSFNGVPAYSNCRSWYYSGTSNYYNGYRTGYKWQCVEYVDRYYKAKFGRSITGGNANSYCPNASAKGLSRAYNGGTNKPWVNDIICSNGGSYGHCAIVREVGSDYIKVIEQNFHNSSSDNSHKMSMKVTTDSSGKKHYSIGSFSTSYPVACWMWAN